MGCWNETDGLTQMPIRSGRTKIILLLPAKNSYWGGEHKESNRAGDLAPDCGPISLPITGDYNEYGSLDNIQKDASACYVEELFEALAKDGRLLLSEEPYQLDIEPIINEIAQKHYIFVDYSDKILSDLEKLKQQEADDKLEKALRGTDINSLRAYLDLKEGKKLSKERIAELKDPKFLKTNQNRMPLGLFFVLDVFYQAAVKAMKNVTLLQAEGYGAHCINVDYHKKCLKRPKKVLAAMKKLAKKGKKDYYELDSEATEFLRVFGGFRGAFNANPHYALDSGRYYFDYCMEAIKGGRPEVAETTLNDILDFRLFTTFMNLARKPWMEYDKWSGCQDQEFYLHKALAEATVEHCKQLEKECKESGRLDDVGR